MTRCDVISEAALNVGRRHHWHTLKIILSVQKLVIAGTHIIPCLSFISVTFSCHRTPLCPIQMSKVEDERQQCAAILDDWVGVERVRGRGRDESGLKYFGGRCLTAQNWNHSGHPKVSVKTSEMSNKRRPEPWVFFINGVKHSAPWVRCHFCGYNGEQLQHFIW